MRKVEILAPAGSFESMKAAVNAGCDAIYIGGSKFGARAFADNPGEDKMLETIDYMHLHGKKIYMTVNTLLKEYEIEESLYDYLKPYYEQGLDAAIVQDVGVAHFIHERFPNLAIHASTQMTITSAYGAKMLESYGINRFVPARELGLAEIREMRKQTDLEIECFVHGALCYCYSGQCLLSSMIGGRSGNRGRCAQPCRMKYDLPEANRSGYLLSPMDIRTLHLVPELVDAGIDSFKIEGRMKRPEYTALCAYLYGKYVDLYLEGGREGFARFQKDHKREFEADNLALEDMYNRGGFSGGYFKQYHGKTMMSMNRPNHYGVKIGVVESVKENKATICLEKEINPQDVLEFRNDMQLAIYDYTVGTAALKGTKIQANFTRGLKVQPGNTVYRTKNQTQLEHIAQQFMDTDQKIPMTGNFICETGHPMMLTLTHGKNNIKVFGDMVDVAKNQPMTKEKVIKAIDKVNDTMFVFTKLDGMISEDAFIPVGAVKNLRRQALAELETKILAKYRRKAWNVEINSQKEKESIIKDAYAIDCTIQTMDQLNEVLHAEEVRRVYLLTERLSDDSIREAVERAKQVGKQIYLSLPYITRSKTFDTFLNYSKQNVDGFLVHNLEEASYFKSLEGEKELELDCNVYTFNSHAKEFWREQGINGFTIPVELNEREMKERGIDQDTLIVYGHLPLMISAQCIIDNCESCSHVPGMHRLVDRKQKDYYVFNCCNHCYNIIYDGEAMSLLEEEESIKSLGLSAIRLDFTMETGNETKQILKKFVDVFRYNKGSSPLEHTHKGHYRRGVE